MTNSPPFDWQVTNLRNYVKISPVNAPPLQIGGQTVASFGQGSGLLGIPGDPTPPSRFVRALGYAASAERQPDGIASVRAAEHILNNFDIPKGWIGRTAAAKASGSSPNGRRSPISPTSSITSKPMTIRFCAASI